MEMVVKWLEAIFGQIPLPLLEVWGRFGFIVGFALMVAAYGRFTFKAGGRWQLGRARWAWDSQTLVSMMLTFLLILGTGYVGSFIVLVPGAQTFESLKDLSVFLCVVLFGYPALVAVPFAYGLSDLIEGVPPAYLLNWLLGYFINPACFWVAAQLIGRHPDFTKLKTWLLYGAFVMVFLTIEPQLWGYLCSTQFTSEISYRNITPALFFTTSVTWLLAPFAMLAAYPLARKLGLFWAEIPGHVKERVLGQPNWIWESREDGAQTEALAQGHSGFSVRMLIVVPFVALVLVMVGAAAYLVLRSTEADANKLAGRLHQEISQNINLQLDEFLDRSETADRRLDEIDRLLQAQPVAAHGRAFVIDHSGRLLASALKADQHDRVAQEAIRNLISKLGRLSALQTEVQYRFDVVTAKPLSRETWLAQASAYQDRRGGHRDWIVMTAMPAAYYLEGVRIGNSQTAMVSAVALTLALVAAGVLAALVTGPIRRVADATQALAHGDLTQRVPGSPMAELDGLSVAFNNMAELLGQYRERMQLAKQALNLGIWDWNVVTDELIWDDQMYRLYGVRQEDFSGAYEAWAERVSPEDLAHASQEVQAALRGEREYTCEFRIVLPDGSIRYLHASSITFRDVDGKAVRMVGSNHDITAQKVAEEEIRQLNAQLEERVQERTAQYEQANQALADARDAAEFATRAKSEFLANMSHEIRTPMNAVMGMTDLALRTQLTPKQQTYLHNTRAAAESLLGIINDILDFSKIEAGKLDLDMKEFLLDDLFQQVTTIVGHKAHEKGLEFLINTAPDVPPALVGDSLRLAQVLVNLCNNAVKFTDRGEIVIVTVQIEAPSDGLVHLRFSVRDTGIGMSADQVGRLFLPFNQADSSTTRKYGGTGLGLAISKQLVELMGGRIGVRSTLGQGSEFFFNVSMAVGQRLKPVLPATADHLRGLHILVVDDSANAREVLASLLTSLGYVPTVVSSASEALNELQRSRGRHPYDLVLMDWKMPDVDGFEAVRQVRRLPELRPQPKVVMVTAYGNELPHPADVSLDVAGYVTKPVSASTLLDAIANACSQGLPPASQLVAESPGEDVAVMARIQGMKVLLIEDNEINQMVAADLLTEVAHIQLTVASNGREALDRMAERSFDLVLTDIQMPVMDGYETTRHIRAQAAWADLPIIAMTAHAMQRDRDQCLAAGMNDFVTKPFDPAELFAVLAKWAPGSA